MSKGSYRNKSGKVTLKNRKKRTDSSRRWLLRQLNDPYVQQAQSLGYRSRSAFKLLDIDQKFKFLRPGAIVVDLGAAPGGWTQVALKKVGEQGLVVAVDLQEIKPIAGAQILQGDFTEAKVVQTLLAFLPSKAELVLSDMAAPASGMTDVDHIRIMTLAQGVFEFCFLVLKAGGSMVAKVLRGGTETKLLGQFKKCFSKVAHFKPSSSRADSAEMYVVGIGFRPERKETLKD